MRGSVFVESGDVNGARWWVRMEGGCDLGGRLIVGSEVSVFRGS